MSDEALITREPAAEARSLPSNVEAEAAFLGAVLGAAVGFIPGIAISYPLTWHSNWIGVEIPEGMVDLSGAPIAEHYLAIPWSMIAVLVFGLPVVVGLVVALVTRSKLPMVARIE